MAKLKFSENFAWMYLVVYLSIILAVAPFIFDAIIVGLIPSPASNSLAESVINDAIVVNGIALGFVLVVLDGNVKEFRPLSASHPDYWVRFVVLLVDTSMVIISVEELLGEMLGLVGVSTSIVPQLPRSLFVPIRFGIYVLFRFVALGLA